MKAATVCLLNLLRCNFRIVQDAARCTTIRSVRAVMRAVRPPLGPPEEFRGRIRSDLEKWKRVVKAGRDAAMADD